MLVKLAKRATLSRAD